MFTRRELMRTAGQAALLAAVTRDVRLAAQPQRVFCLFSKHLPELNWSDLGRAVKDSGFEGVDLTVRPGGHVLPERAADDLPRAIEALTAQGLKVPMITTDLTSASVPVARPLLQAAARSGVTFFKAGYWRYSSSPDVRAQLTETGKALEGLAALASECGIETGIPQSPGLHRRRAVGHRADHGSPRSAVGRLLLRSAARGGGRRWGSVEGRDLSRRAAAEDAGGQGLPLDEIGQGLGDRELSARGRAGRLGVCRHGAGQCQVRRSDLGSPRVRDPGRNEADARRCPSRSRLRAAVSCVKISQEFRSSGEQESRLETEKKLLPS